MSPSGKTAPKVTNKATPQTIRRGWLPERGDIIWIDCNPQAGREMRDRHPMLVLSPKAFNDRTSLLIGLPMTSSTRNEGNPFALDVSRAPDKRSFVLCHQPKSFDWRHRHAAPHPWRALTDAQVAEACEGLDDIISLGRK